MSEKKPLVFEVDSVDKVYPLMQQAVELVDKAVRAGVAVVVTLSRPNKSREQEKKYHALIGDIRAQASVPDPEGVVRPLARLPAEHVKAALVDAFADEMQRAGTPLKNPGSHTWNWISRRFVAVRPSTTQFSKDEAAEFVEWLYEVGSDLGVVWSPIVTEIYGEYREAK